MALTYSLGPQLSIFEIKALPITTLIRFSNTYQEVFGYVVGTFNNTCSIRYTSIIRDAVQKPLIELQFGNIDLNRWNFEVVDFKLPKLTIGDLLGAAK